MGLGEERGADVAKTTPAPGALEAVFVPQHVDRAQQEAVQDGRSAAETQGRFGSGDGGGVVSGRVECEGAGGRGLVGVRSVVRGDWRQDGRGGRWRRFHLVAW